MANSASSDPSKSPKKKRTLSGGLETSLQHAIRRGDLENARSAFQDAQNSPRIAADKVFFAKALWTACEKDRFEIVEMLLEGGVDVDERVGGRKTALMVCDTARMVDLLMKHNANVDLTDDWGKTALMQVRNVDVAHALISHRASVEVKDPSGRTALWHAMLSDKTTPVAQYLLENDAKIDVCDSSGRTLWSKAAERSHLAIVRKAVSNGASVRTRNSKTDRNILHHLCENKEIAARLQQRPFTSAADADCKIIELILERCDVKAVNARADADRKTSLHMAVVANNLYLVKRLLDNETAKADLKVVDGRQKTALHSAANSERTDIARELIEHGADVNAKTDRGWTALHIAASRQENSLDTVRLLIERKADVTCKTRGRKSALHVAAESGNIDVVKTLLDQDDVDALCKDSWGNTALLSAVKAGHKKIVELLIKHEYAATLSPLELEASKGFTASLIDFAPSSGRTSKNNKNSNIRKWCPMYTLLSGHTKVTLEQRKSSPDSTPEPGNFRWIHLPSNNVAWAQQVLIRWFMEQDEPEVEKFKRLQSSFDREHVGDRLHAHYMRPACEVLGSPGIDRERPSIKAPSEQKSRSKETKHTPASQHARAGTIPSAKSDVSPDMYMFMPYVHCERMKCQEKRHEVVQAANAKKLEAARSNPQTSSTSAALAPLHRQTTEDFSAYQKGADERLIQAHVPLPKCPLHIRRTLDQYFYRTIDTFPDRDTDQVVLRYQQVHRKDKRKDEREDPRLLMVDQLWLWIISDELIITSFPRQYNELDNSPERHNVLESIVNEIHSPARSRNVSDVHELATIIAGHCSGAFDRRNTIEGEHLFLDMFESEIGDAMNRGTQLFREFEKVSMEASEWLKITRGGPGGNKSQYKSHIMAPRLPKSDEPSAEDKWKKAFSEDSWKMAFSPRLTLLEKLLDITCETELIREVRDIRDELEILKLIFKQQETLLDEMRKGIVGDIHENPTATKAQIRISRIFDEQKKYVENPLQDIERMEKQAERVEKSMADLLEQKQKHANAIQAADTARQGLTLMVFTVVTVIFLPMSFLASIFTINIREFPHLSDGVPEMSFRWVSQYVFGIGIAIAAFCVVLAFFVERLHRAAKTFLWNVFKWRRGWSNNSDPQGGRLRPSDSTMSNSRSMNASTASGSTSSSSMIPMKVFSRMRTSSSRDVEQGRLPR